MIPQAAALAQNSIIAEAAPSLRDAQPLERLVETINQMRESGQLVRGEVSLRHSEFGMIAMRVSSVDGELQARLASRDPGFVNAAQMALNERQVLAASESNPTSSRQNDSSGAGQTLRAICMGPRIVSNTALERISALMSRPKIARMIAKLRVNTERPLYRLMTMMGPMKFLYQDQRTVCLPDPDPSRFQEREPI
jgi:hypothetical protein